MRIQASFTGMDVKQFQKNFVCAVPEGDVFSSKGVVDIIKFHFNKIDIIFSVGGGTRNKVWFQKQADVFDARIGVLSSEEGSAIGAAR